MTKEVKVTVTGHNGPSCEECSKTTTTYVLMEDIPPDYFAGDTGVYCPSCIKKELSDA